MEAVLANLKEWLHDRKQHLDLFDETKTAKQDNPLYILGGLVWLWHADKARSAPATIRVNEYGPLRLIDGLKPTAVRNREQQSTGSSPARSTNLFSALHIALDPLLYIGVRGLIAALQHHIAVRLRNSGSFLLKPTPH